METQNKNNKTYKSEFLAGIIDIFPMLIGMVPFGLIVGTMGKQAGLESWELMLMSSTVFAGASQFIALDMWQTPLPGMAIIGTTLMVNLRHVLMSASASPHIRTLPPVTRYIFICAMADENWAMFMRRAMSSKKLVAAYVIGLTVPFYLNWQLWSFLGTQLGDLIKDPVTLGFDFVFTAVFITLVHGFWKVDRRVSPIIASACIALIAHDLLPGTWYIFLGSLGGIAAVAISYKFKTKDDDGEDAYGQ